MIPWFLKIHIEGQNKKYRKIWIPLPLIYVPVLILMIAFSPLLIIGFIVLFIVKGINMFKAIPVFFTILTSSEGFLIDISSQKEKFHIAIK
jgi:hypothetical protein